MFVLDLLLVYSVVFDFLCYYVFDRFALSVPMYPFVNYFKILVNENATEDILFKDHSVSFPMPCISCEFLTEFSLNLWRS